jgi:hypothetical protein
MAATVITYHRAMGRWEPNARGRLAQAALTLYARHAHGRHRVKAVTRVPNLGGAVTRW